MQRLRRIAVRIAASVGLGLALLAKLPAGQCAETTILSEDFEGVFPSSGWTVGDLNTNGVEAYWDDVDAAFGGTGSHSGNWKGYCAGFGYGGGPAAPTYRNALSFHGAPARSDRRRRRHAEVLVPYPFD